MASKLLSDSVLKEEFSNWAKAMLSLQNARDGSINYIKRKMEPFVEDQLRMHGSDEEDHFQKLLTKVAVNGEVNEKKKQLKPKDRFVLADNSCKTCDQVFEKQLEAFEEKQWSSKNMVCHKIEGRIDRSSYWWVLAKMYMLKSNVTDAEDPTKVEPSALFKLLLNCTLFETLKEYGKKLMELRNKLVHSAGNRLKKDEMKESFKLIKDFLMQVADNKTEVINEVEKLEQTSVVLFDEKGEFTKFAKEALELQQMSFHADFKTPSGILNSSIKAFEASNIAFKLQQSKLEDIQRTHDQEIRRLQREKKLQQSKLEDIQRTHDLEIIRLQREKEEIQQKYDALDKQVEKYKLIYCTIS